jgi:segregation and condensation protein B
MAALAERKIIPHEELKSRSERKAEAEGRFDHEAQPQADTGVEPETETQAVADSEAATGTGTEIEAIAAPRPEHFRLLEALLFAASEPLDEKTLGARLPEGVDLRESLRALQLEYAPRGVNLVKVGGKWTFRTAADLSWLLTKEQVVTKKLSRAAIETLAVIAYHQPVTRAEVEEIRGVVMSKGTFDVLMETGWIRPRGRRKTPGRPITYGTNETFLQQFGLEALTDLPGLEELKGSGMLDGRLPPGFAVPMPSDDPELREDEDPLEPGDLDLGLAPPPERVEE